MAETKRIRFTLNGEWREAEVRGDRILLDFLREDLGITGTKKGCEEGECGACTVIMNGKSVLSCLIPAVKADGAVIETVEGMSRGGRLHPLQEAFLKEGAIQCGYCTPGMLLSAKAFLDSQPEPSEEATREAISGNLCRCTGYAKIVRAVASASKKIQEAVGTDDGPSNPSWAEDRRQGQKHPSLIQGPDPLTVVGKSIPRVDALGKVTGASLYAGDVSFPGMLHLRVFRSDRPHAKILRIRIEEAEGQPGVVAILTHGDVPGMNRIGHYEKDQPVLCDDRVRFVGDPIVLVAAETPEASERALELIRVDYEDLPGLFSPEEALRPDAVKIHETGNLLQERSLLKGDPDRGMGESEVVVTNIYRTQMVEHAYLEPEAGVADFRDGKVTVWMPSKYSHLDRMELAGVLGLPLDQIRIVNMTIGGYFGEKTSLSPGYYAALAALKTGRPCKMVYTREESIVSTRKRHPFIIHYQTGAKRDGRLVAVKVQILADTGAYAASGPAVLVKSLIHAAGPYEIPHIQVEEKFVYTNNPVGGSMRGLGVPQVAFAHESQMDVLAETLHMDPFEIRLKNGVKPGSVTATGQPLGESVGFAETILKVRDEIGKRGTPEPAGSKRFGWGIASMIYGIGLVGQHNPSVSRIEANDGGRFTLYIGIGDGGQGSSTVLTQIAAEVLHCPAESVGLVSGDTDRCPDSGITAGSRVTYIIGRSVQNAAENLAELLQGAAAFLLEADPEELVFGRQGFHLRTDPSRGVSVPQVVQWLKAHDRSPAGEDFFDPQITTLDLRTAQGHPMPTYAFATQGAFVSLDLDSGEVEVLSLVASHDIGRAINPSGVIGQIEGSVSMGLGYALTEEVILEGGRIRNPKFSQYFIPTSLDMPEIISHLVECPEPSGPFGAKGVGEPALIPTAPAIVNAIRAAANIRAKSLPATPEAVWRLLPRMNPGRT
jgi:aldehyde oxidoreductase